MRGLLLTVAIVMLIIWGVRFFFYTAGAMIHLLLVVAVVLFIISIIRPGNNKPTV